MDDAEAVYILDDVCCAGCGGVGAEKVQGLEPSFMGIGTSKTILQLVWNLLEFHPDFIPWKLYSRNYF